MIEVEIELEDLTSESDITVCLPCDNIGDILDASHEYAVAYTEPDLALDTYEDICKLNKILDEINSENPEMTMQYFDILLEASGMREDIFNPAFAERLKNNDFYFADISEIEWKQMDSEQIAACYLATEMCVPFDESITKKALSSMDDSLIDYIDWSTVWAAYQELGFKLIDDFYIVHW